MRPRHLCLGCDGCKCGLQPRPWLGFNEAEASLPRMQAADMIEAHANAELQWGRGISASDASVYSKKSLMKLTGFNEAEASLPRMPPLGGFAVPDAFQLQWGRGISASDALNSTFAASSAFISFNEAEASLPRMPAQEGRLVMSIDRLQWGRGISASDAALLGADREHVLDASMRPRHLCLGCLPVRKLPSPSAFASMRPRHLCLGCHRCSGLALSQLHPLQWGRGISASDATSTIQGCPIFGMSFNEAEASLPRMLLTLQPVEYSGNPATISTTPDQGQAKRAELPA